MSTIKFNIDFKTITIYEINKLAHIFGHLNRGEITFMLTKPIKIDESDYNAKSTVQYIKNILRQNKLDYKDVSSVYFTGFTFGHFNVTKKHFYIQPIEGKAIYFMI